MLASANIVNGLAGGGDPLPQSSPVANQGKRRRRSRGNGDATKILIY
jgi:hypothetical protein